MTIIDWMNQLLIHKKHWNEFSEDEQKKFSPFIINRWLSMDEEFIEIVNYFQKYSIGTLEPREVYKWYCDVLPKGKRFNKYIKGKKSKKYDKKLLELLSNYFQKYAIGTLEPREVYKWYCDMLPRGKRFNKYIKGKGDKKYDKEMIDIISNHFEVSKQETKAYIDLLDKQEIKEIYKMYGVKK